ncbi:MAG: DUF2254 domain-containing protein [Acidimicrobiia bacterium]|nr:DUF2254 domain-containing protein [Acidimicrobiia bacterium]
MRLLNWGWRFRLREQLRSSLWVVPMVFAIGAVFLNDFVEDAAREITIPEDQQVSAGASTTVLAMIAGSMMTITAIVFSVLTLTVQYAGATISPRAVRTFYRDRVVKASLGMFVGTFTYSLFAIAAADDPARRVVVVSAAVWLAVISTAMFIVMVNHVGQGLRAASMVRRVNQATHRAINEVHPHQATIETTSPDVPAQSDEPGRIIAHDGEAGFVMAVDFKGLARHAAHRGATITLIPTVGEFISPGSQLFAVHEPRKPVSTRRLTGAVAVGEERTIDHDPAFGIRILVDTAIKALSPGVNDPTTAVVALDQIHDLLRTLATRDLSSGQRHDQDQVLRFTANTPSWADYLDLGLVEIAEYGAGSFQVTRRLHALLDDLQHHTPQSCRPALAHHQQGLDQRIANAHIDPSSRHYASAPDPQGIGSTHATYQPEQD